MKKTLHTFKVEYAQILDADGKVVSIPVGSQTCHAAGIALGMKIKGDKSCAIVFFGDGATSEGDFHESLNFAAVFDAPCIFLCQNNQYAISVPVKKQTKAKTIAQKAIAYGMPGIQVDGNDILAVYWAVAEAAKRARTGKGPTLIECFTYRLENHTTSDDATRYRTEKEVKEWEKKDPLLRTKKYLTAKKVWSEKKEKAWREECAKKIDQAVHEFETTPPPAIEDMFIYMYEKLTPLLQEQLTYAKAQGQ